MLRNFMAAERKRHMVRFGLFSAGTDLSWIDEIPLGSGGAPIFQDFTSQLNGAQTVFNLNSLPASQDSVLLVWNGLLMKRGLDYTLSGPNLTVLTTTGFVGQSGQTLFVYIYTS
jgi:hypothetical protein